MSVVRPSKKVFLQVLWNGIDSSVPSLYLFTDTRRYVFNCGEGLQRLFTQRKIKLGKLDTFFLTSYQWSHMGGLPGFGLTLKDMGNDTPFSAKIKQGLDSQKVELKISEGIVSSDQKNSLLLKILEDHHKSILKEQEKDVEEDKNEKEKDLKEGTSVLRENTPSEDFITSDSTSDQKTTVSEEIITTDSTSDQKIAFSEINASDSTSNQKITVSEEIITSDSTHDQKNIQLHKTVGDQQKSISEEQKKSVEENEKKEEKDSKGKTPVAHKVTIYAPQGMQKIINAAKSFVRFEDTNFKFEVNEHTWEDRMNLNEYSDDEISLYSIPIYSNKQGPRQEHVSVENNVGATKISPKYYPPSLCYACQLRPFPGKFNVKSAKKLGVTHGPLYGQLQRGEDIVLENGKVVTSKEVMGPEVPGPIFLIIDCPSIHYIDSLMNNTNLEKYLTFDTGPHLVVHLSTEKVCKDSKYNEWIKRFPTSTVHMYLNNLKQESVVYESQHSVQIMLNHINSEIFPLTKEHDNTMARITNDNNSTTYDNSLKNFLKINLRELINNPSKAFDNTETKSEIDISELLNRVTAALNKCEQSNKEIGEEKVGDIAGDVLNVNGKRYRDEELNTTSNKKISLDGDSKYISNSCDHKKIYPKTVCLGTGAAIPSKYRNVSSTLVFLSEDDAVLLDCGEGTYGQLFRHYGDNINSILSKIKFIFISHMHGDHHLGLITLIRELNSLGRKDDSFIVMGPGVLHKWWLSPYAGISESLNFKFLSFNDAIDGIVILQNIHVQPVKVEHPAIAHGVVLTYDNDMKVTYSGDTLPCDALIAAGANSTLLIHEATLEDDMVEDAKERKHSTTSQAIDVAKKMNAEFVILTHFSQRYPKIPIIRNKTLASRTAYGFDHMEIALGDIPKFFHLLPALTALYTEEHEAE